MAITFHLMDFDRVQQFALVIKNGPFTGDSWEIHDHLGQDVPGVVSYAMTSDSVSEEHKIVLTYDDHSTLELAVVGVSQCLKTWNGPNESTPSDGKSSPP